MVFTGLKLKAEKCEFFKMGIVYLGHVVSKDRVQMDKHKIEAVRKWPVPQTITEVRSFLRLANYYHQFQKGYASDAHPLYELLPQENVSKKSRLVQWTEWCEEAFEKIKDMCCTNPILAFVDWKPFVLHTDASGISLGAVLYQITDRQEHVIRYRSHTLNKGESHYPAQKLEFLALMWAVTMVFHEYQFG